MPLRENVPPFLYVHGIEPEPRLLGRLLSLLCLHHPSLFEMPESGGLAAKHIRNGVPMPEISGWERVDKSLHGKWSVVWRFIMAHFSRLTDPSLAEIALFRFLSDGPGSLADVPEAGELWYHVHYNYCAAKLGWRAVEEAGPPLL